MPEELCDVGDLCHAAVGIVVFQAVRGDLINLNRRLHANCPQEITVRSVVTQAASLPLEWDEGEYLKDASTYSIEWAKSKTSGMSIRFGVSPVLWHLLAMHYQQVTRRTCAQALGDIIGESGWVWTSDPQGYTMGAVGLLMTADAAKRLAIASSAILGAWDHEKTILPADNPWQEMLPSRRHVFSTYGWYTCEDWVWAVSSGGQIICAHGENTISVRLEPGDPVESPRVVRGLMSFRSRHCCAIM